jgi:hypothetical protein
MNEVGTVKIHCISETKTPLTHMSETSGNEAIINREKIYCDGNIKDVPVISGNALRHKIIREPGAFYLVQQLGLQEKLNIDQANFLFTGGSLSESSTNENLKRIADMQQYFPLYRLLGGSLKNQIIGGSLFSLRGVMICEENRENLKSLLPENYDLPEEIMKSCENFITDYQYTRTDGAKFTSEKENEKKSNLMIYNGQAVIPGSLFYHGFILDRITLSEIGALFKSIQLWNDGGSFIGGMGRIGHGKLDTKCIIETINDFYNNEIDVEKAIENYENHVAENKENCINWLNDCFPHKGKKLC